MAVVETCITYIKTLLATKREHLGKDLISGLLQVEEQGDTLSENELVSMIWLLIVAGHETTVNLLSNGTLALLQHPEQMRLLRADPGLVSSTVEELLRYAAPVLFAGGRVAGADIPFRGQVIHRGDIVRISS